MFPKPLQLDIVLLLGAKAIALALIWFVFFAPLSRPEPTPAAVQNHLLGNHAP
jgi:hypothetical protein